MLIIIFNQILDSVPWYYKRRIETNNTENSGFFIWGHYDGPICISLSLSLDSFLFLLGKHNPIETYRKSKVKHLNIGIFSPPARRSEITCRIQNKVQL